MGVRLPSEYQEVAYIGTVNREDYLDTGIYPQLSDTLSITFQHTDIGYYADLRILGAYSPGVMIDHNEGLRIWTNRDTNVSGYNIVDGNIHTMSCDSIGSWTYDGTEVLTEKPIQLQSNKTLTLFRANHTSNRLFGNAKSRIFSFQYARNGQTICDLVPCYRKADSKPGMYDLVTKQFFINQGTGEFLVGPDVIDSISPMMVAWRRIMMAAASVAKKLTKLITTSATGLVSFDTNVEMPTKVTCEFSPVQDLHGYDHPWPAGGEKNLLNATDIYDDETSVYNPTSSAVLKIKLAVPNGTYTISTNDAGTGSYANVFAGDSTWYDKSITTADNGVTSATPKTITVSDGYIVIGVRGKGSDGRIITRDMLANGTVTIQLEEGSSATAYVPYENICPISGWTGVNIEHTGACLISGDDLKNFFAGITLNVQYGEDENGKFISWSGVNRIIYDSFPFFKPGLRYTFVFKTYHGAPAACYGVRYSDGTTSAFGGGTTETVNTVTFTTEANKNPNGLRVQYLSPRYRLYYEDSGIFIYPDSDSNINYQKQTLSINWQTEAGTVYGGELTINEDGSADLVADKKHKTYGSQLNWIYSSGWSKTTTAVFYAYDPDVYFPNYLFLSFIAANRFKPCSRNELLSSTQNGISMSGNPPSGYVTVRIQKNIASNVSEFKTWLADNPIDVVYIAKAKDTFHFDNIGQLQSFLDKNNIWSDIPNDITVKYWNRG